MNTKPTVISFFAGCGGSSLGYHHAGFRELLAVEWDAHAVETFRLNFKDVTVWQKDIKEVQPEQILEECKIKVGELDVLDGSPPCQGFSTSGNRDVTDKRNDLFMDYKRMIVGLKPKVFLMENVPGMIAGPMRGRFIEIIKSLKETGYRVKCKVMNSAYYGVPQSRKRLIFIGVREDLNIEPSFPKPSEKAMTVRQAFDGLKDIGEVVEAKKIVKQYMHMVRPGENYSRVMSAYHGKGSYFSSFKLHPNRPSNTICSMFSDSRSSVLHWKEPRILTINEVKRLCSFPDDFKMTGSFTKQWNRLGNAVMPGLMKAVAINIRENILNKLGG